MRPKLLLAFFAATQVLLPTPSAAAINKCVDASGKVTYQSEPCSQSTVQQQAIKPDAPSPRVAEPKADDASQDEVIMRLVTVQAGYEYCSKRGGGLGFETEKRFAAWRAKSIAALRRYEQSPRFRHLMEVGQKTFGQLGPEYCRSFPDLLPKE